MASHQPVLKAKKGRLRQTDYALNKDTILLGSSPKCDVHLEGADVSPIQVMLQRSGEQFVAIRKGKAPFYVNERQTVQAVLSHGDELRIGESVLTFLHGAARAGTEAKPEVAAPGDEVRVRSKNASVRFTLVAIYLVFAFGVMGYFLMNPGQEWWEVPVKERIQMLDSAHARSSLPHKDELRNSLREILVHDTRLVDRKVTIEQLRAVLQLTYEHNETTRDGLANDKLYQFIVEELRRQEKRQSEDSKS